MEWNSNYFNNKYFNDVKINDNILNIKLKLKESIESKISNLEDNFDEKIHLLKNNTKDFEFLNNQNSLKLLDIELNNTKLLSQYILKNKNIDYIFFKNSLNYLLGISEILRERINQKEFKFENNFEGIKRSSYKFCKFKDSCKYNYTTKEKICYQDHYVHNMVSNDLQQLLLYIEKKNNDDIVIHDKDILKSINTLSFVISHMENELKTKCMYIEESEYENMHFLKV
jgi:hypothetical protein